MTREKDSRDTIANDIRTQLGLIAETAMGLQGRLDQLETASQTTLSRWFARKGPTVGATAEGNTGPVPVSVPTMIVEPAPTECIESEPTQINVFKADDNSDLLPVPSLSATTPDTIAKSFNRGALESLRAKALASNDPKMYAKWNLVASFSDIYQKGNTIQGVARELNIPEWKCYELRREGFAPHTYGDKIQMQGARNTGAKHGKKRRSVKKNKVKSIGNNRTVNADVRTLSDIEDRIELATSEAIKPPVGNNNVASPSALYTNADPELVSKFNPSTLWGRYNAFVTGSPVDGDTINAYNMDYTALNMYLHGANARDISSQLDIDASSLINSMFV